MYIVVLDTNILVKAFINGEPACQAILSQFYGNYTLCIALDIGCTIQGEYMSNLSQNEAYQKWFRAIFDGQQIYYYSGKLSAQIKSELLRMGFHELSDHAFVGTALQSDRCLITEDSDYGIGSTIKALDKKSIFEYLTIDLGLKVLDSACGLVEVRRVG